MRYYYIVIIVLLVQFVQFVQAQDTLMFNQKSIVFCIKKGTLPPPVIPDFVMVQNSPEPSKENYKAQVLRLEGQLKGLSQHNKLRGNETLFLENLSRLMLLKYGSIASVDTNWVAIANQLKLHAKPQVYNAAVLVSRLHKALIEIEMLNANKGKRERKK